MTVADSLLEIFTCIAYRGVAFGKCANKAIICARYEITLSKPRFRAVFAVSQLCAVETAACYSQSGMTREYQYTALCIKNYENIDTLSTRV